MAAKNSTDARGSEFVFEFFLHGAPCGCRSPALPKTWSSAPGRATEAYPRRRVNEPADALLFGQSPGRTGTGPLSRYGRAFGRRLDRVIDDRIRVSGQAKHGACPIRDIATLRTDEVRAT